MCVHTPEKKSFKGSHLPAFNSQFTWSKHSSVPNSRGPSTMNSVLQAPHNSGSVTEILSLLLTQFKPIGRGDVGNSTDRHRLIWYCKSKENNCKK